MVQMHMIFGSSQFYDSHFNIAHALRVLAYFTPFIGLIFDYVDTHLNEKKLGDELKDM